MNYSYVKDEVNTEFDHFIKKKGWEAENITDYLLDGIYCDETYLALYFIAISLKEITNGMLEERVHDQICHYIPAYKSGKYNDQLYDYEKQMLDNDIEYILKHVELYEVREG